MAMPGTPVSSMDDWGALAMHLFSGLVPMRHMVGGIGEAHVPMTEGAAQHAHVGVRPQGASEQPGGRHALPPLAIEPIRFRPAGLQHGYGPTRSKHVAPMYQMPCC